MLALWDTFATDILSTVRHSQGKVRKVMNIKDVIWSVIMSMCIWFEAVHYKTNNALYASKTNAQLLPLI